MTSAKRELIDSAVFLDFLLPAGAIVALVSVVEMWLNALRSFECLSDGISLRLNYFVWACFSVPRLPRINKTLEQAHI